MGEAAGSRRLLPACLMGTVPLSVEGACGQGHTMVRGAGHTQTGFPREENLLCLSGPFLSLVLILALQAQRHPLKGSSFHSPPEFQCCLRGAPWAAESSSMDSFIGFLMPSQDDVTQILWNMLGTMDLGTLVKSQRRRGLDQGARQVR